MVTILIRSKSFGYVVFGTFDNECDASHAIVEYREKNPNSWTDSIHFEWYEGDTANHMAKMWD